MNWSLKSVGRIIYERLIESKLAIRPNVYHNESITISTLTDYCSFFRILFSLVRPFTFFFRRSPSSLFTPSHSSSRYFPSFLSPLRTKTSTVGKINCHRSIAFTPIKLPLYTAPFILSKTVYAGHRSPRLSQLIQLHPRECTWWFKENKICGYVIPEEWDYIGLAKKVRSVFLARWL